MTDKQPKALWLADALDERRVTRWVHATGDTPRAAGYAVDVECAQAAAELRRLHEVEIKYHESVGGFKRDLAEKLEQQRGKNKRLTDELRRLHEVNVELLAALDKLARLGNGDRYGNSIGNTIAQEAIAKATGEQQ